MNNKSNEQLLPKEKRKLEYTTLVFFFIIAGLALLLSACGGSSGTSESQINETPITEALPDESGQVMIIIQDDEEDFLSYDIEVLSIDLIKNDGTQVSVAPSTSRVDFIQYADLSELFSINTIPAGTYNQISFTLDYTDASIVIQDELGTSYQATAQDSEGQVLSTFALSLMLDEASPLVISKNEIASVTLDLDLASSNQVLSFEPAIVQVEPFVNVSVTADDEREHRARGLLQSVDSENNLISIAVKPMRRREGEFGSISVSVNEDTLYEIDGESVENTEGLAMLSALALDSPFVAYGMMNNEHQFTASEVLAGTSVAWAGQDGFRGVVIARNDNNITVSGLVLSPEDRQAVISRDLNLTFSDLTQFTGFKQQSLSAASLTIGQKIRAIGDFDNETTFATDNGIVHISLSKITGQVVQADPLVIDLSRLNRRPTDVFDFTGTGISAEQDADVEQYEINKNNLSISDLVADDWLTLKGTMTDFGLAPMDFNAQSLIKKDLSQSNINYKAIWTEGSISFAVDNDTNALSWSDEPNKNRLSLRGLPRTVTEEHIVTSVNSTSTDGRFAIKERGVSIRYFAVYTDFADALTSALGEGKLVGQITSKGQYDEETQSINALAVSIVIK